MTDKQDLIREILEYVTTHGGENTATHLLVQAASAIQTQAEELEAVGAGGAQAQAQADSVQEDAERLKEVVGLLEELAEHDNYHAEYDGQIIAICPECGKQEGEHRPSCAFVRAKAYLAARAAQGGKA